MYNAEGLLHVKSSLNFYNDENVFENEISKFHVSVVTSGPVF